MDDPSRLWIFLYLISLDAELITSAFVFAQREQTQSDFEELEKTRPHYYKAALNYLNHPGRLIKAYAGISTGLFPLAGLSLYFLGRGAFAGRRFEILFTVLLMVGLLMLYTAVSGLLRRFSFFSSRSSTSWPSSSPLCSESISGRIPRT